MKIAIVGAGYVLATFGSKFTGLFLLIFLMLCCQDLLLLS